MTQQLSERPSVDEQSPGVRTHLELTQGVIERMATNSRSCKLWCVTVAAAVLVLVARTDEAQHALIALVPTGLFLVLDAYYLALEEAFITSYKQLRREAARGRLGLVRPLHHLASRLGTAAGLALPVVLLDLAVLRSDGRHDTSGVAGDPLIRSNEWQEKRRGTGCSSAFTSRTSGTKSGLWS